MGVLDHSRIPGAPAHGLCASWLLSCSHAGARSVATAPASSRDGDILCFLVLEMGLPSNTAERLAHRCGRSKVLTDDILVLQGVLKRKAGMKAAQWRLLLLDDRSWGALGRDAALVGKLLAYFHSELSLSRAQVQKIVMQRPSVLSLNLERSVIPKVQYLQGVLGLKGAEVGKALFKCTSLFTYSVQKFEDSAEYCLSELGLSHKQLRKLVLKAPTILGFSLNSKVIVTVDFLSAELGITRREVGTLLMTFPQLMTCSLENNIKPFFDSWRHDLGLDKSQLRRMFMKFPVLLGYNMHSAIQPKIEYMNSQLGLELHEIGKIVAFCPQVLSMSLADNIKLKAEHLQGRLFLSPAKMGRLLQRMPTVFNLSLGNLERKIAFLLSEGISPHTIASSPAALTCSLETRIRPRYLYLKVMGLQAPASLGSMVFPTMKNWLLQHGLIEKAFVKWCQETDYGATVVDTGVTP